MAKKLRQFAPGLADVTPTADYCEVIFWEQRREASSSRSVIYGSACGRWCAPRGVKWGVLDMWSAGGNAGAGCCCMQGPPAQGGNYQRACMLMAPGWHMCHVIAHGGCCEEEHGTHGCFTMVRAMPNAMGCACICGGRCGRTCCYYGYCCWDRTGEGTGGNLRRRIDGGGDSEYPVPQFKYENANVRYPAGNSNYRIPHFHRGRAPWMMGLRQAQGELTNPLNKNHIPRSECCYGPFNDCCTDLTRQARCDQQMNEHCAASAFCQKLWRWSSLGENHGGYGAYTYNITACCGGCAAWGCGDKPYTQMGSGIRTSGPRWVNHTSHNNWMARGGWEQSQWMLCHNGSNNHLCWANVRTVGMGGMTGRVCGGPCCCGGWGGHGMIMIRYKGTPWDEKVCYG